MERTVMTPASLSLGTALALGALISSSVAVAAPQEQAYSTKPFTSVSTSSINMAVKVGPAASVILIGEPAELAKVDVVVEKDRLKIRPKRKSPGSWRTYDVRGVSARITTPFLKSADVGGSGDIFVTGINSKSFEVAIGGSGSFTSFDAKVADIDMAIGGSGTIEIAGTCQSAEISIGGSGTVKAQKLMCASAEISIGGSGDVAIHASKSVETSIAGSGDVIVYGNPGQREKSIAGSGTVTFK
jgi:hypothetical protein